LTPAQISLLKQQNAETPDELLLIHPADRLMIRLIKIPYLADRLKGMQFKVNFEETITLLEKVSCPSNVDVWVQKLMMSNPMTQAVVLLQEACNDLREAKQFKALLNVILQLGNYINGSNYAGGAWGFKLSSINRVRLALAPLCNNFALT
jgi:cytokinesis protein